MRKILVYFSLFIALFTYNVNAQDFYHTSLDKCDAQGQTALADHSCGVFDEDGVQIMDSGDVISSAQIGGYYPASNASNQHEEWFTANEGKYFGINIMSKSVYTDTLKNSFTIKSTTMSGVTQTVDGVIPISIDLCSTTDLMSNLNYANTLGSGFDLDGVSILYTNTSTTTASGYNVNKCYRLFARIKAQMMYIPATQAKFNYRYISTTGTSPTFRILNPHNDAMALIFMSINFYTVRDYNSLVENADYVVYLQTTSDRLKEQTDSIKEFSQVLNDFFYIAKDDTVDKNKSDNFFNGLTSRFQESLDDYNKGNFVFSNIVLLPIKLVDNIDSECRQIKLPFSSDKLSTDDISLPCGNTLFWDKPKVKPFRKVWNFIVGAPIVYVLLLWSFKTVQKTKDPLNNDLEMIEL